MLHIAGFLGIFAAIVMLPNAHFAGLEAAISGETAHEVEHRFEARYRHAATLKAIFFERYSAGKGTGEAETGTVYFSRPGRMRWEYESPAKKLFIIDGKNVWSYIPEDHTASRATLKNSSDWRTPVALLAQNADLGRVCKNIELVKVPASGDRSGPSPASDTDKMGSLPTTGHDSVLTCAPRSKSDEAGQAISDILLTIDSAGYLVRVLIQQPGNVATEFRFGNWHENVHIAEAMFHFQPPPGVEIVDEDKLAGQIN
ncbi:MAG TPA: outer membrane lipoprotein carrier protein LolA [Candidatus Acidoferrum sp.]|nr:outer membrane lipoprotein carrier protein LolA [Candidatus Acidoferrum sp.]